MQCFSAPTAPESSPVPNEFMNVYAYGNPRGLT
jgi:hypothetical protein